MDWLIDKTDSIACSTNYLTVSKKIRRQRDPGFPNIQILRYSGCQKNIPIDFANPQKIIAGNAKQSLRVLNRLLRRKAPRNDGLSEYISDNRCNL